MAFTFSARPNFSPTCNRGQEVGASAPDYPPCIVALCGYMNHKLYKCSVLSGLLDCPIINRCGITLALSDGLAREL